MFFVFLLSSFYLCGQTSQLTFSLGTFSTSRILLLNENIFDITERDAAKNIEVPKLSYDLGIGMLYSVSTNAKLEFGLSHRWLNFGTRKYNIPDSINSVTTYPITKETINQSQILANLNYAYTLNKLSDKVGLFGGTVLVFNYKNYMIKTVDYDSSGNRRLVGKIGGEQAKFHVFDVKLNMGAYFKLWDKNSRHIILKAYTGCYVRPYDVFSSEAIGGYLPFKKNTSGIVWDIGVRIIYSYKLDDGTRK